MISKERLNEIALEVLWKIKQPNDPEAMAKLFTHALLKAVQEESEVVAVHPKYYLVQGIAERRIEKLIALPLVSSEE